MNSSKTTQLFFIAVSLLSMSCRNSSKRASMPPLQIESAIATTQSIADKITFSTSTEAIRSATIEPRVSGYLQSINYNSGTPVKRGDLLFEIDPTQLQTTLYAAEAALQSAEATLIEARNNYQRATPLVRINAISATTFDQYTASYRAAEANLKSAEQSLKNAQLDISYTAIYSPLDGLIAETPAAVGDYVGPATKFETLTTISQIDTLTVTLAIPTSRYMKYIDSNENSFNNSNLLSDITLILPNDSIYKYKGEYDYTQKSASSSNSTVGIVAKIPNPNTTLKSDMFVRVVANIGAEDSRIIVPQRAVTQMQGVNSVWIIKPDSSVTFRNIELGNKYGDDWQVTSGLNVGEMVATSGQLKLHEGSKVVPIINKKQGR